jgi:glycosyltransferase involved in cell wall biosynthesis
MNDVANPLVSVVIPTYNHARYLGRALQSVLDQTYTNWEVIVIDNHSTDNTDEVMASFSDPRITYLKIHNNGVIAASRNAGIRAAKGEWIAFLDSDDWWTLNKLQVCFDSVNHKVDLVYHDLEIVSEQSRVFRRKIIKSRQVNAPVLIDLLENGNALSTSSVMVRLKLLNKVKGMNESPNMVAAEDYNTWLRISQLTDGFKYISKQLGFYQLHNQGISSQKDMSVPASYAAEAFIDTLSQDQRNKFEGSLSYPRGRFNYLTGDKAAANASLFVALKYGRISIKVKSALMLIFGFICR